MRVKLQVSGTMPGADNCISAALYAMIPKPEIACKIGSSYAFITQSKFVLGVGPDTPLEQVKPSSH